MIKDKKVFSWALYDWGNSAYSTTVMVGFFPLFFQKYWSAGTDSSLTTARLGTAISVASLLIALCSPTLGAIADLRSMKKLGTFVFMIGGVLSCIWMAFIDKGDWFSAVLAFGAAMICFTGSCVFYDALLPYVAAGKKMHEASALGYSLGYLGGGVLFLLNVLMYLHPQAFGLADEVMAIKASFITVGIWWFLFTLPLMKYVPEVQSDYTGSFSETVSLSFVNLKETVSDILKQRNVVIFIAAYWLYIDGVYTVMSMAVDYGSALGLEAKDMIGALLLTQFIGFPAALLFGKFTHRFGARKPILVCIGVYCIAVILATRMSTGLHFYALAAVIGLVMGGVQSLSRSFFGQMIPKDKSAEYFGLFNLIGKFASILGPAIVGITVYITGRHQWGMLGLLILFAAGGVLLLKVREDVTPHASGLTKHL
jgi:UMF1 family MFS transporter